MRRELEGFADKLRVQWCESLFIEPELTGKGLVIGTPFMFTDGDEFPAYVTYSTDYGWRISDHGVAVSRAFSTRFEETDARLAAVGSLAEAAGLAFRDGELLAEFDRPPEPEDLALFISCVSQVVGLPLQVADAIGSDRFTTRVRSRVTEWLPPGTFRPNWHPERDPRGDYKSDLKIAAEGRDIAAFFVGDATKSSNTALTVMQYREWNVPEQPLAAVKRTTVGNNSRAMHRLQNALGTEHVVIVEEDLDNTGYLGLRRTLTEMGAQLAA